jgi:hypothetical protein
MLLEFKPGEVIRRDLHMDLMAKMGEQKDQRASDFGRLTEAGPP